MKDYIVCFAGGPLNGTAQEQEYIGATARCRARNTEPGDGPKWDEHIYEHDELFSLNDGRHVLVARYKGKL